jgi:hypothetical protein
MSSKSKGLPSIPLVGECMRLDSPPTPNSLAKRHIQIFKMKKDFIALLLSDTAIFAKQTHTNANGRDVLDLALS